MVMYFISLFAKVWKVRLGNGNAFHCLYMDPSSANPTLAHPQPILAWPINRRSVSLPISDFQLVLKRRLEMDLVVKFIGALLKLLQVRIS